MYLICYVADAQFYAQFYEIHSKAMPNSEPSPSLQSQFKKVPNSKSYPSQWNPTETVPDSKSDPSQWNSIKSATDSKSCPSLWKPVKAAPNSKSCPSLRNPFKNGARLVWGRFSHTLPQTSQQARQERKWKIVVVARTTSNEPAGSMEKEIENSHTCNQTY